MLNISTRAVLEVLFLSYHMKIALQALPFHENIEKITSQGVG